MIIKLRYKMEKDIGKLQKNDTTDIVLRIDDFGGRRGLTIREFVTSDRYTGFTKAGVRIMAQDFPKFKEMINSVSDEDVKPIESSEDSKPDDSGQAKLSGSEKSEGSGEESKENSENLPDY